MSLHFSDRRCFPNPGDIAFLCVLYDFFWCQVPPLRVRPADRQGPPDRHLMSEAALGKRNGVKIEPHWRRRSASWRLTAGQKLGIQREPHET